MRLVSLIVLLSMLLCAPVSAQDWAKEKLEKSPRHLEWVDVKRADRTIKCFVAYPEIKEKAAVVLVIHEIFGLSDWIRDVCDEFAKDGFIAIAPDLLSGKPGEETAKYDSVDEVRKAVSALPREQLSADMAAVLDYGKHLPSANGDTATAGFCWGGTQVWLAMTNIKGLKAGFVFYGTPNASIDEIDKIESPVYGFYGENDNRVTSTVDDTIGKMKSASKTYIPKVYKDAGHGFMRTGEAPDAKKSDGVAREDAWKTMMKVLHGLKTN